MGPLYCALTLLDCISAGRRAVEAAGGWVFDLWFMDDGQLVMPPEHVAAFLAAFDTHLGQVGGSRVSTDGKMKSTAKLLGAAGAAEALGDEWTHGVQETCEI